MAIDPNDLTATAKLTFAEEFDAFRTWNGVAGLDVTANVVAPLSSGNPGTSGYANNGEMQWYVNPGYQPPAGSPVLPNPFSTRDGVLTIAARPADAAIRPTIGGQTYTSGVVSTYHEFSQTYGYFEMRAELPAGNGLWPAFWLMPDDGSWPPEIDVMEQLGKDPGTIYTTVHSKVSGVERLAADHVQTTAGKAVADTSQGFHRYGVDWERDTITWYFDGRETFRALTPADADKPMYMIANLAVGGTWPGSPDGSTLFPAEMKIDYLRAYSSRPADAPTPAPVPATNPGTLTLRVAQDAYGEDAQFLIRVDGVQVGGIRAAHASHAAGAWDVVDLAGTFSNAARVSIEFVNDANDGHGHDRNLYVGSVALGGHVIDGSRAILDAGIGSTADGSAALWSNGKAIFTLPTGTETTRAIVDAPIVASVPPGAVAATLTPLQAVLGTLSHGVEDAGGQIYALYDGLLGRAPDPLGLETWAATLAAGTSLHDVAAAMLASTEGQARIHAADAAAFVEQLYATNLHRASDPVGKAAWLGLLGHGTSRADVALSFALSDEHVASLKSVFEAGIYVPDRDASAVARLYHGLLARAPDAEDLRAFTSTVAHGSSLQAVAQAMLASDEYETLSTGLTDAQFVDTMYRQILGRSGDGAGEQVWRSFLDEGGGRGGVADGFTGSLEFQSHFAGQGSGAYVEALYERILGRAGDTAGLQAWTASLDAHSITRTDVAHLFTASAEFQAKHVASSDPEFVDSLYENALGRHADVAGSQIWTNALARGASRAEVAVSIAESAEAQQHLISSIESGYHFA